MDFKLSKNLSPSTILAYRQLSYEAKVNSARIFQFNLLWIHLETFWPLKLTDGKGNCGLMPMLNQKKLCIEKHALINSALIKSENRDINWQIEHTIYSEAYDEPCCKISYLYHRYFTAYKTSLWYLPYLQRNWQGWLASTDFHSFYIHLFPRLCWTKINQFHFLCKRESLIPELR